jgi:hypothetical protein
MKGCQLDYEALSVLQKYLSPTLFGHGTTIDNTLAGPLSQFDSLSSSEPSGVLYGNSLGSSAI